MEVDANVASWLAAIRSSTYDSARQLLRPDQDVNVRGAGGVTALHVVARLNSARKARKLLPKLLLDGADPQLTNDDGHTPLHIAQRHNHTEVVQCLLLHDELLRALERQLGQPPLLEDVTVMMRHTTMRRFREDARLRLKASSMKLISAAREGDLETVRSMVESNEVAIDAVDEASGETAFSASLAAGQRGIYEYLLANDAHLFAPCIVGGERQSVLVTAAATRDVDLVRRLAARGAIQVGVGLDFRTSPLAEAVKSGSTEMVDALLELGLRGRSSKHGLRLPWPAYHAFDFSSSNLNDVTPWWLLAIACWQQDTRMIDHLFQTQAELSDRSKLANALFLAVYHQNERIVADLLDRGVSVNASIAEGATAVVAAVSVDSLRMLHFLIDRGALLSAVQTSFDATTGYAEGLLVAAVRAGTMACAHELLSTERRQEQLEEAIYLSAGRNDVDFAHLLLDVARPLTPRALMRSIGSTSCPLMLDLLLSQCDERFDFAALNHNFPFACQYYRADIVSVLLAHGIDFDDEDPSDTYSPLVGALLANEVAGLEVAKVLVENGIELAPRRSDTPRLVTQLETLLRDPRQSYSKQFYEAGREFLIARGLHQSA